MLQSNIQSMDIIDLLKRPEGKALEFKRDLSSVDGVLRTLIAFANTAGGTLLIGVEDGTRQVRGVSDPLALEERLVNALIDGIAPRLVPEVEILPWRRTNVLAIQVHPSPTRPHYLRSAGMESGVYVRVGSTNRRADAELVAEMRRAALGQAFDEQAMPELDSEAIDFRAASESFAPVRKIKRGDLTTLRLLTAHQGRKVPTVGGILLFGRQRDKHFPDAWIQAGRFAGLTRTRIADSVDIRAPLPQAVEQAIGFVEKHSLRRFEVGKLRRKERWSVPMVAVREAIINAVVHADYAQRGAPIRLAYFDDRLEIENPGLLPFGLTVDDLQRGTSKLRNRVIGRVFHELRLIEQWGSGIQRMTAACRDAGLAAPALEEIGTRFRVTLHTDRVRAPELDATDAAITGALSAKDGLSTNEIATRVKLTPRATRTRLISLIDRGLVREVGTSPQDPQRRYYLAGRR
jgi:predicted HTH transcriptional regulator